MEQIKPPPPLNSIEFQEYVSVSPGPATTRRADADPTHPPTPAPSATMPEGRSVSPVFAPLRAVAASPTAPEAVVRTVALKKGRRNGYKRQKIMEPEGRGASAGSPAPRAARNTDAISPPTPPSPSTSASDEDAEVDPADSEMEDVARRTKGDLIWVRWKDVDDPNQEEAYYTATITKVHPQLSTSSSSSSSSDAYDVRFKEYV